MLLAVLEVEHVTFESDQIRSRCFMEELYLVYSARFGQAHY